VAWLNGLLTRATPWGTPNFSLATWEMMMLSSSSPVTADDHVRHGRCRPSRAPNLGAVAEDEALLAGSSSTRS